jgi:hypothetical protein
MGLIMSNFNPRLAIAVLEANPQTFGLTAQEQAAYVQEASARLGTRKSEDRREAAKLAVETAKMFLTITVGVLVASFAWMQFARTNGVPWLSWTLAPFYVTAVLLVASMTAGFGAISTIYKRADGREAVNEPAWSTTPVAGRLNAQSLTGSAALLALFLGVIMLGLGPGAQKLTVTIPGQAGSPPAGGSLTIEGDWTELRLRTAAQQEIKLPKQTVPVMLTCQ